MELVGSVIKDVSVLRRMLFAASNLPQDVPHYWEIVASFSCVNSSISLSADRVKLLMENLQLLSRQAFATDAELTAELLKTHRVCPKSKSEILGVALISDKQTCRKCGGRLLIRQDRPSRVILYTESMGTVPASHYHKYCQNHRRGCKTTQFYGYVKEGDKEGLKYDIDWEKHAYILSSQETGFQLSMLQKFDAELLIGQVSYKQKAEIYNVSHGYDTAKKEHKNQSLKSSDNESTVYEAPTDVSEYCSTLTKRQSLDRRRFEAAHLRYAVLKVAASYPELMGTQGLLVYPDVEKTLQIITPALYSLFKHDFLHTTASILDVE